MSGMSRASFLLMRLLRAFVMCSGMRLKWPGDDTVSWIPFVTALHDLGKISSPFQRQAEAQRHRLEAEGFTFETPSHSFRHQLISGVIVDDVLRVVPALSPLKRVIRDVWAGHHGIFPTRIDLKPSDLYIHNREPKIWTDLRADAIRILETTFPFVTDSCESLKNLRRATAALTGFVILCDWLGSDQDFFGPSRSFHLTSTFH